MTLETRNYSRVPFHVDAVQVTEENLEQIAEWAGGEVKTANRTIRDAEGKPTGEKEKARYIKIETHRPLNERQTRAFIGDWVLKSDSGFKIYTAKAFSECFVPSNSVTFVNSMPTDPAHERIVDAALEDDDEVEAAIEEMTS